MVLKPSRSVGPGSTSPNLLTCVSGTDGPQVINFGCGEMAATGATGSAELQARCSYVPGSCSQQPALVVGDALEIACACVFGSSGSPRKSVP